MVDLRGVSSDAPLFLKGGIKMKQFIAGVVLGIKATINAVKDIKKDRVKKNESVEKETREEKERSEGGVKMIDIIKKNKKKIVMASIVAISFFIGFRRGIHHANFKLGKAVADAVKDFKITRF